MKRFEAIAAACNTVPVGMKTPLELVVEQVLSATEAVIGGRPTLLAGTNNYLGLSFDADCRKAAADATMRSGTGTTGSRLAGGNHGCHTELEKDIAAFLGRQSAVVFSTGFMANLGVLSALAGKGDAVLLDADCHASIFDGVRLGGAEVYLFRHNDPADLERRVERLGPRDGNVVVVVEGLYSMLGDQCPMAEIAAIKRRHPHIFLIVDEAHSFGIYGANGRGAAEAAACEPDVDMIIGTFSKALGAVGGFCASNHPWMESMRATMRSYLFSASLPPGVIASVLAALSRIRSDAELRNSLWRNAHDLHTRLSSAGFAPLSEPGPILAIPMPSPNHALAFWNALLHEGIYVNLMIPPATPRNLSLLRCSVCSAHTGQQIEAIADAFARVGSLVSVAAQ